MENLEFYYPISKTSFDYTKVIPQLIEIINRNQIGLSLTIPSTLITNSKSKNFSETVSSGDSFYSFNLEGSNETTMCYHFTFKNLSEAFDMIVCFNLEFPEGKVGFEFKTKLKTSTLEDKIRKMIIDYVNYSNLTDNKSLFLRQGEGFSQASVSLRLGFVFGSSPTADGRQGGGLSHSLEEFVYDKKGHYHVKSVFSDEDLKGLILAAELSLNYPYLFEK
jgi:hypothetical protein